MRTAARRPQGARYWVVAGGAAVLLATLTGCVPADGAGAPSSSTPPAGPAGSVVPHDAAAPGTGGSSAGLQVAVRAVRLFCRPAVSRAEWIAALDPDLTLAAASAYQTVDPARVPCRSVTGPGARAEGDAFTQVVVVPTDAGRYRVTLSRAETGARWLVFRLAPSQEAR